MRRYRVGAHSRYDLKVHLVRLPKYRKRVLTGAVAVRARDLSRQIAAENDLHIISGKVAADHVHLFISYRAHQNISQIVQWLKGTSSRFLLQEFPHLERQFWAALPGTRLFRGHLRHDHGRHDQRVHQRAGGGAGRGRRSISNRPLLNPSPYTSLGKS